MTPLSGTTSILFAGGLGTRLRSVVADRPKVLAEVNGRPFLTYLLDQLATAGIRRAVLCTGYKSNMVRVALGASYRGIELIYSEEEEPMGTGGALRLALPLLGDERVLVMNGDSFCDADLVSFAHRHQSVSARCSLVLARVADVGRYGAVQLAPDGVITIFEEKGAHEGEGLINAGIYLLDTDLIAEVPAQVVYSLERELFPQLTGSGLYGFEEGGRFIDIGIPNDYYAASAFFAADGRGRNGEEKR